MTDRVFIDSLSIETVVGVFDWERRVRQSLTIDVELRTYLSRAGITDRLEDTVDYTALSTALRVRLESSRYRLVETLACDAAEICLESPRVASAVVTVHKPGALRHARDVAVQVERLRAATPARPPHRAFIGVGSNLEPIERVRQGLELLHGEFGAIRVSPTYVTEPIGAPGTPDFLNLVVEVRTERSPIELVDWLRQIEDQCGRRRSGDPHAPRSLDLDLLLYDAVVS
jgi:2-amino-4-hydroxy-6-hydroxymethyldihydropteridine diphosphokinase